MTEPHAPTCAEIAELMPAYALEALAADERGHVAQHVRVCGPCRALLQEYADLAEGLLAAAPACAAPSHLEAALLRRLRAEPTRPPSPWWQRLAAWLPAPARPAAVLAALLAVALVISNLGWARAASEWRAQQAALAASLQAQHLSMEMLAAGGQRVVLQGSAAPEASGEFYFTPDHRQAVLITADMPPLPAGMVYQLWLVTADGQRDNGGVFSVDAAGHGVLIVDAPHDLAAYARVGVTREPAGGSPAPTNPATINGPIS